MRKLISCICISALLTGAAALRSEPVYAVNDEGSSSRLIPVYRKSMNENESLACLFFDDLPDVPYIPMELYYHTFMESEMTVNSNGSGAYSYTEEKYGQTAFANADTDILVINDPAYFVATPVFKSEASELLFGGPDDMVKVSGTDIEKQPAPLKIDLGGYGIDLREKDGVLYYPFATLCDLFNNVDCLTAVYSHGKIFFVSMYDEINGGNAKSDDLGNLGWVTEEKRPDDLIRLAYSELCLSAELFYGYPCDDNEFTNRMKTSGLDAALTELDPVTRGLLLSSDPGEYMAGVGRLFRYDLCDGGHTGASLDDRFVQTISNSKEYSAYYKYITGIDELPYYYTKQKGILNRNIQCSSTRKELFGETGYHSKGNTAYIIFNSFIVDYAGWRDYYSGRSSAMPADSISVVYNGFLRAGNEGVKNVIIDLTANTGGDTIALQEICGMLCGDFSVRYTESLGGGVVVQSYSVDRDLDGEINEADDAVSYKDFNIAVMTSASSFSCSNIMPLIMKDMGIPIIGEQSSGGSCVVLLRTTADGFDYSMSAYLKVTDKDGGDIDKGIPVDIELGVTVDDVSAFYDVKTVGALVEEYYRNNTPAWKSEPSEQESSQESTQPDSSMESSAESKHESKPENSDVPSAQAESAVNAPLQSSVQLKPEKQSTEQHTAMSASETDSGAGTAAAVTIAVIMGLIIIISVVTVVIAEKKRRNRN